MDASATTLAGVAAVLIAVKPHLAYLFWIALMLWSIRERRWRTWRAVIVAGVGTDGHSGVVQPAVLQQYWHTFTQSPPAQYRSPTLDRVTARIRC